MGCYSRLSCLGHFKSTPEYFFLLRRLVYCRLLINLCRNTARYSSSVSCRGLEYPWGLKIMECRYNHDFRVDEVIPLILSTVSE